MNTEKLALWLLAGLFALYMAGNVFERCYRSSHINVNFTANPQAK